jgi:hypothetical protein
LYPSITISIILSLRLRVEIESGGKPMKTSKLWLAGLAVALVLGLMTQAQERSQRRLEGPTLLPPGVLERLDLTAEQKEKIAKLEKDFQAKIAPAKKKLDEAIEHVQRKAEEAQEAFRKEVAPIGEAYGEKIGQVLSEDQKRRLGELNQRERGRPGFDLVRALWQLDLNEDQKQKINKLLLEFKEKEEAGQKKHQEAVEQAKQNQDRAKLRELIQAREKEVSKDREELLARLQTLLTGEQKKKFAEVQQRRRAESGPPGIGQILPPPLQERLGLTPEQRERLVKLQRETEAKLKDILNDEQSKKLDELKKGSVQPERRRPRE